MTHRIASWFGIAAAVWIGGCSSSDTTAAGYAGAGYGGGGQAGADASAGSGGSAGLDAGGSGGSAGARAGAGGSAAGSSGESGSAGSSGAATDAGPQTFTVKVGEGGFSFNPSDVTISVGDTVHWVWAASGHTVTSGTGGTPDDKFCSPNDTNCATSPTSSVGATYDHTFATAGAYPYFCRPHFSMGMTGTITVAP